MSPTFKSLVLLAATLIVGFSLGLFADATLLRERRDQLRGMRRPPGFVAHMESVIEPHSDAQRDSIRGILERQAARNDSIMRTSRERLRAGLDSMRVSLSPLLDPSQRDRLAHEVERGPDAFGRGGPPFGRGGPPFGRRGGPRGGPPRVGGPPQD
ncbi:MAG: hypothetical protein ACREPM_23940 [Gemmatimonadaceae bacterium]